MNKLSFYVGRALSHERFHAVASFDALEHPTEPSQTAALMSFSLGKGWDQPKVIENARFVDVEEFLPKNAAAQSFGLTAEGVVFDFVTAQQLVQLDLAGAFAAALSKNKDGLYLIANNGHYFRLSDTGEFVLITNRHIINPPAWDADGDEMDRFFNSQSHIMNASVDSDGRVAMTEISRTLFLNQDHSISEIINPRVLVGVTFDEPSRTFWFCGHSPQPIVAYEKEIGQLETVFLGQPRTNTFTDLALYEGEVFLADTNLNNGGLFKLISDSMGLKTTQEVELPPDFGRLPVWKIDAKDGVLWVLRTKDLLRFDGSTWDQFPIPDAELPE